MPALDLNSTEGWPRMQSYQGLLRSGTEDGGIISSMGPPQFALAVEVIRLACACLVVAFEEDPQPLAPSICQMRVATSILGLLCRVRCTDRVDLHPACLLDQGAMVDVSDGRCQQRRLWWWKRTTSCQSRQAWYNLQSFSSVDLFLLDYCCSFDSTVVRSW